MHELGDGSAPPSTTIQPTGSPRGNLGIRPWVQKAQRRGVALARGEAEYRDNARAQVDITVIGLVEARRLMVFMLPPYAG